MSKEKTNKPNPHMTHVGVDPESHGGSALTTAPILLPKTVLPVIAFNIFKHFPGQRKPKG